jgi:DNA polymerase-3 subunit epsilon
VSRFDLAAPWADQPVVVIDFETTGVTPADRPVEVAAVRFDRGRVVRSYSTLLDPGQPIPPGATAVHGITDAMVLGMPTLTDVAVQLFDIARDAIPCAYNAPFDRRCLHAEIAGTDCPAFTPLLQWIDVYVIIAKVDRFTKGKGQKKLGAACERWNVPHLAAHRAEGDATATGLLLYRLLECNRVKNVPLARLLEHTVRMRGAHDDNFQAYLERQRKKETTHG